MSEILIVVDEQQCEPPAALARRTSLQEWCLAAGCVCVALLILLLAFLYCCHRCSLRRPKVNRTSAELTSVRVEGSTASRYSNRAPTLRPSAAESRVHGELHRTGGDITRDDVTYYIVICPRSDLGPLQWYLQNPDLNVQRIIYVSEREDGSVSRPATPPPPYSGVITASAGDE